MLQWFLSSKSISFQYTEKEENYKLYFYQPAVVISWRILILKDEWTRLLVKIAVAKIVKLYCTNVGLVGVRELNSTHAFFVRQLKFGKVYISGTSGFLPRVRARALRAPVFFGSMPRLTGRCAPHAHCYPQKNTRKYSTVALLLSYLSYYVPRPPFCPSQLRWIFRRINKEKTTQKI